jgi:hypothetical protein
MTEGEKTLPRLGGRFRGPVHRVLVVLGELAFAAVMKSLLPLQHRSRDLRHLQRGNASHGCEPTIRVAPTVARTTLGISPVQLGDERGDEILDGPVELLVGRVATVRVDQHPARPDGCLARPWPRLHGHSRQAVASRR